MIALHGKYLIKGVLDHKENYELEGGITLKIDKSWDNNLRTRNSQLGIVAQVPDGNPLKLREGDMVVVHHFSFHGDVAANKGFELRQHIVHNGELLFVVDQDRIFARYNNKTIEPIGEFVFAQHITRPPNPFGLIIPDHLNIEQNKALVLFGNTDIHEGDVVVFPENSMYEITLDKVTYQRINKRDIFGYIRYGVLVPYREYFIAKDLPAKNDGPIDLSLAKPRGVTSEALEIGADCKYIAPGERVYRGLNSGLKYEDKVLLNDDHIHFKIEQDGELKN